MSLCRTLWCGTGVASDRRWKQTSLLAFLWSAEPAGFAVTCFMLGFQPRHRGDLQRERGSRAFVTMGKEQQQGCKGFAFPSTACSLSPLWSPSPWYCWGSSPVRSPALLFLHTDGMECHLLPLVLSHHLPEAWLCFSLSRKQLTDYPNFLSKIGFFSSVFFCPLRCLYRIKLLLRQNLENKQQAEYNL